MAGMAANPLVAIALRARPVGATVDFCPVCRCERPFDLAELQRHRFVLLIDRGAHGGMMHELTCRTCGCLLERPTSERPRGPTGKHEELPVVQKRIRTSAAFELRRREGRLSAEERDDLLRGAFYTFNHLYTEDKMERVPPGLMAGLAAVSLALVAAAAWVWLEVQSPLLSIGTIASIVLLIGSFLWWIRAHSPRHRVRGWVAASIAPLNPTLAEIEKIRREMMTQRLGAGFAIRPRKLHAAVQKRRRAAGMVEPKGPRRNTPVSV